MRGVAVLRGGDHVVGVDVVAGGDGLRGEANELSEFEYAVAGSEGDERDLVAGGNVRGSGEQVERGVRCDRLAGDGDVVSGVELDELGGDAHSTRVTRQGRLAPTLRQAIDDDLSSRAAPCAGGERLCGRIPGLPVGAREERRRAEG